MSISKEDRRIRRTKKLLRLGLAELMNEKDFKDITVTDITERVDLNRGTFYLHYCDTYDLLEKIEDELIQGFENMIDNYHPTDQNSSAYVIIDQVFDYVMDNMEICKTLFLCKSTTSFQEKFMGIIMAKGFEIQKVLNANCEPERSETVFCFLTHGIVGVLRRWLASEKKASKEEVLEVMDSIISNVLRVLEGNKR